MRFLIAAIIITIITFSFMFWGFHKVDEAKIACAKKCLESLPSICKEHRQYKDSNDLLILSLCNHQTSECREKC